MPTDPLVGTTVAHYEVVARLGGGGMGVVYAARDSRLGRRVALKFLPAQWTHDEEAKQRFMREAQAASATDHPNICTIHDIGEAPDGRLFIVMAQYDGQSLKQRLDAGRLSVDEAIDIAAQVAEGLARAHAQGVVHRDIKPGNLMLTEDGVRILDFGLAKFADTQLQLTQEGSTLGTVAYMSPEQTRGDETDARSDIWSTGAVLYEMLTGRAPFRGGYPEAIAHAIRTEPPASIRDAGIDIPETLEQIVFRALHKNPAVRYQSARDFARALRQLQGRTLPLDLQTEAVPVDQSRSRLLPSAGRARRARPSGRLATAAAGVLVVLIGTPLWLLSPVERQVIAVAPVSNESGDTSLDPYRLALTSDLIGMLDESRVVRPVPFDRLLQIVRRFRGGGDISSREALQAIGSDTSASVIVTPVIDYVDNAYLARVVITEGGSSAPAAYETAPVRSALSKRAVYDLMPQLAQLIDGHFTGRTRRAYVAGLLRAGFGASSADARLGSIEAAAAFADGIDAYEQQEFGAALEAFTRSAEQDPANAMPAAWRSRVARLMGLSRLAAEAAAEAERRGTARLPDGARLFVEAVVAEATDDSGAAAGVLYRDLVNRDPSNPAWAIELGAFLDRQARFPDAAASYTRAIELDPSLVRAQLELCRLAGPVRRNDPPAARTFGEEALKRYQTLQSVAGEAQARWCLADALNGGDAPQREEAMRHVVAARDALADAGLPFNLARAENYVAFAFANQGRLDEAAAAWERALEGARATRNAALEPSVLTNLSVAHQALGSVDRAVDYLAQGYALLESVGLEQRAAQNLANGAFLRIEYGLDIDRGLREVQNALGVLRAQNDRSFEVFCLRVLGLYYHYQGRFADAALELNRAVQVAAGENLEEKRAEAQIHLGRLRLDEASYVEARSLLQQAVAAASGFDAIEARLYLARTEVRIGAFDAAAAAMRLANADLAARGNNRLTPLADLIAGEVAYESGQLAAARAAFARAAAAWTTDVPAEAAVEARAYLGLLNASAADARAALAQAEKMGRFALAARARLHLARIELGAGRIDAAWQTLSRIPDDTAARTVGRELRALVLHTRSSVLAARGDAAAAQRAAADARALLDRIRTSLSDADRFRYSSRPDLRPIG